jgi:hypothetical protein
MALTLQQRVNTMKSVPLTDSVTFIEKVKEQIKRTAQDVCSGQFTNSDAVFTGHAVTDDNLKEWALRALRGAMDPYMIPMILDDGVIPADPADATDMNIKNATQKSVWPYARLIGTNNL